MNKQLAKDNPNRLEPWTLSHLWQEYEHDLKLCTTENERSCCRALCFREMRMKAIEFMQTRKLTPGELIILERVS